ncbi:rho GTPase-activating protein 21-like isoform X3 [Mercenaria mercenaria]|uniref:rho GTPase-activating protein 21-like isoform X3 n=1 Tax=Mercenaria mercenaria TaxID=6596 RepID=UPI00234EF0D7|nr:rho GTPase-activating protein 21-like isoform X3 [Mercenaria mercenaria]
MDENESDGWHLAQGRVTPLKGPRTVTIPRTDRGFGFTLRHFIVYPPEPKDFLKEREYASDDDETEELFFQRVQQGSLEPLDTIFVKNVKEGGPAHKAGLNPGDRIISVNGEPVTGKSYGQVINLIQQTSKDLSILVVPKEEDILQLAYQTSSQSYDSDFGAGPSVRESRNPYSRQSSMDSNTYISSSCRDRDRKVLSTSNLDSHYFDGSETFPHFDHEPLQRRQLKSSTSYTSGLSVYRDQQQPEENMNKNVFLDRRREFENRAAQENVNPNASKTYSFGLYFPKKESRVNSAENLTRSVMIRRSKESVLQSTDSQENISKLQSSRTRNVPIEYRHSGSPDQKAERFRSQEMLTRDHEGRSSSHYGSGSSIRHSFPDSGVQIWTSPSRKTSETSSPYGFDHGTPTPESSGNKRDSYNSSRQYVPVINESPISKSQKITGSVDSIDPRSNIYHTEHHLRTSYNNNSHSSEQQNQNQPSSSRTFIVKIGDNHERSSTPNVTQNQAGNHSYGAAFALTRSPASTEIEIRQKREPRILVSHRKKQFEERKDVTPPPVTPSALNSSRFKSEIEKITTFRKFDGIQARLATYEKNNSNVENIVRSRSQTPVSAQPISKSRPMSQERVRSPEPHQNSNTQYTQGSSQSNFPDSAPIRIYVSQGNSNTSGSPIVEIVHEIPESRNQGQYVGQTDSPRELRDQTDSESGQKPVRKASFLSAVNAPYSRYLPQTGYDNETPECDVTPKSSRTFSAKQSVSRDLREGSATPTNFQWSGRTPSPARAMSPTNTSALNSAVSMSSSSITVSPVTTSTVRLRNKPDISAEDFETKLHRRTSYLMATAPDRSAASLKMSPTVSVPLDPNTPATLSKHKSMRKLKDFFGEKTPKIVEATERRFPDPASPIQQVTKEGSLGVKVDMIDGKRASDRSWRPVWAVLRGHALYLCKERRDPANYVVHALSVKVRAGSSQQTNIFSYDEQPISIKSCIVDIAHSYTKRKNVFRMKTYNGSEYLLQAEDHEEMISWIEKIKSNNNPDSDSSGVTSSELIIRKSQELVETSVSTKTSPPQTQKMGKKLSVLSIKQKIPHSPSLKRRKTTSGEKVDESGKPKTWKGKLGKSFKKQFAPSPSNVDRITPVPESAGMFGSPLEDCTPSPNNEFVPLVVDLCIQIVEARGLEMIGVFRIPGNKAAVTLLQEEFNKGIEAMNLDHEKWSDVNVISSLLKSFFRQLPEPLIPDDLYQPFIDANRIEDPERRMLKLKRLIHELPEHHFETFKHLAKHLNKVAQYGDINRMEAKNLAIVFGPTLIRKADDNMVAMVTDMSDHCKIIESIILHYEWFFGSWENDSYVPTDDDATECVSLMSAVTSSTKDDTEVNPQEIVSSIVEAANRKLRGEHPPTVEKRSVSVSEVSPKFNERNIDQEILLRTRKIDNTSRSSPNLAAMQRSAEVLKTSSSDISTDRRMAKSQEFGDREFKDFDYIDSDKESSCAYLTPTTRYFSDESLLDRNDELELSHSTLSGSYSRLSKETIDSLKRIEMEARALREREERRQRDLEKRKLEKQRIEQDILQTRQELEIEERHSIEDLLNAPDYTKFGVSKDYSHKRKIDSSEYRNSRDKNKSNSGRYLRESPSGGKYFVIKGNSPSSRPSRPPKQTSVESLVAQSKRTGSLENMVNGQKKGQGRPLAQVRARKGEDRAKRDSAEIKHRSNGFSRSSSVRRGSLDSLIDLIEKRDSRMSWASTDSDEGLDLLTTLTSTFDQKLQTLSSPKLSQSPTVPPPPPRRMPNYSSNSSLSTTNTGDSGDSPSQIAQHRLPPQVPLSSVINRQNIAADFPSKQYRDPSLHRTPPKPDTKIGLATRFERSTTHNPLYEGNSEPNLNALSRSGSNYGESLQSDVTYSVDSAIFSGSNRVLDRQDGDSRVSSVMVVISSPSVMSADSRHSAGYSSPQYVSKPVMSSQSNIIPKWESYIPNTSNSTEYRPISKAEKTEVNVKLSQTVVDKNKISNSADIPQSSKSRSASPPPSNRKRSEKKKRRRHTVGGTNDGEHIKAISDALPKEEQRRSAWEQLRPNVGQHSNIGPNSSMLTWLRNERLRGSSPDLSMSRREKGNGNRN